MAWLRVGDLLVADDATTAGIVNNSASLTRAALNALYDKTTFASQAEAQSGTNSTKSMSPQRVKQAYDSWIIESIDSRVPRLSRVFDVNVNNSRTGQANITFPAGMFSTAPVIHVTLGNTSSVLWHTWFNHSMTTPTGTIIGATLTENVNVNTTIKLAVTAIGQRY